jgi:hypothetical protein
MFVCLLVSIRSLFNKAVNNSDYRALILVLRYIKEKIPTKLSFEMDLGSLFLVHTEDEM